MPSVEEKREWKEWAQKNSRHYCCQETPWPGGSGSAVHEEVEQVGEQRNGWPEGDWVTKRCKICGHTWEEELPQ